MHMCRRVIETSLSELRTYYVGVCLTGYALLVAMHVCMYVCTHITGYDSTLHIGIAMVFVFSPYILKYSSYFQFHVSFNDFIAQHMSKLSCVPNLSLKFLAEIITKNSFPILSMFFFFSFLLKTRNSITVAPIDMKLHIWSGLGQS